MLWIPSANTARVIHENAFQLCAQKKKSISSLPQISSKTVNPIVCSLRTQSFCCSWHICLVFPIFQHHEEFSSDLGLVYSASLEQRSSEVPLVMPCRAAMDNDRAQPFLAQRHPWVTCTAQKWPFRHRTHWHVIPAIQNADPGLNPGSDTIPAARAGSAFDDLTEMWSFALYDLASSRGIFYKKIQFYCTVNTIWQSQVKASSLIAWKETKSSQIHTHPHGEKIHHVLPELWGKQHRNRVWAGDITRRCRLCSHPKPSPAELVLLTINCAFVLEEPKLKQFGDPLHCCSNVLHLCCLFAGSWDAHADSLRLLKFCFICEQMTLLHNTLACEPFRKRERHNWASVELGRSSSELSRVTQRAALLSGCLLCLTEGTFLYVRALRGSLTFQISVWGSISDSTGTFPSRLGIWCCANSAKKWALHWKQTSTTLCAAEGAKPRNLHTWSTQCKCSSPVYHCTKPDLTSQTLEKPMHFL